MKTHAGRKLGRTTGERNSLLKSQATSLLKHEHIQTTYAKAREVSRYAERLLAKAKKKTLPSIREVNGAIQDKAVQKKIYDVLVPRYQTRPGGVTKVVRLGQRAGDGAEMALVKLIA
jgi:large subunit ribosomal protein L17